MGVGAGSGPGVGVGVVLPGSSVLHAINIEIMATINKRLNLFLIALTIMMLDIVDYT